jgi:hypothetical protein
MDVVGVAPEGGVLRGVVHPLDLTIGPGMVRLDQAMFNVVLRTGELKRVGAEDVA